ncbi:MAG: Fe-S protein assembly co-chaperone HscB [Acidobacteriota bacterium]
MQLAILATLFNGLLNDDQGGCSTIMIDFSADHFALFHLPRRYRIDAALLDREYRALQSAIHPDRHATGGDESRRLALQASARVNEAYATLRDPAARGEYLLGLHGVESLAETDTAMPADFLLEQMERREAIDDARASGDQPVLEQTLAALAVERAGLETELAMAIDDRVALDAAKSAVRKLRFLDRVQHEINDALTEAES